VLFAVRADFICRPHPKSSILGDQEIYGDKDTRSAKRLRERRLIAGAKSRENGIAKLLGLKNYQIGKVTNNNETAVAEVEIKGEGRCPFCRSTALYRHGICEPRQVLHTRIYGTKV